MADDDIKRTVDGVPVKVGDRVWYEHGRRNPTLRKLDKWDLGFHWAITQKQIYSTERLALEAAVAGQRRELNKLEGRMRTTKKAIERLTAKLRAQDGCTCWQADTRHLDEDGHLPRCPTKRRAPLPRSPS